MKLKKLHYLLLICAIVAIISILGIRIYYLTKINNLKKEESFNNIVNSLNKIDSITINKKNNIDDYFTIDNIKIRNDFKDFKKAENSSFYVKELDGKKIGFMMGEDKRIVDLLNFEMTIYGENDINASKIKDYIKYYNIKDDIDLLKYYGNKDNLKVNLLSSTYKLKSTYNLYSFAILFAPSLTSITEINGDYNGYMLYLNNIREVNLYKNNKRYILTFVNTDYFTDDYIKDLISTVEVN